MAMKNFTLLILFAVITLLSSCRSGMSYKNNDGFGYNQAMEKQVDILAAEQRVN